MERSYPYLLRLSDPRPPDAPVEPLEAILLPKVRGKRKAKTMRHMGKQAQIIATFSSIMVHRVEAMSTGKPVRRYESSKKKKGGGEYLTSRIGASCREIESGGTHD